MKFVSQNYYEILDVDPTASHEDVKRAYRLVRGSFEPDSMAIYSLYSPEETEAIGAKIDEAFRILTHRDRRRVYDKYLHSTLTLDPVPDDPDEFLDNVHDIHELSALEELVDEAIEADAAYVARADVSIEFGDEDEVAVPVQMDLTAPLIEVEEDSLEPFVDASEPICRTTDPPPYGEEPELAADALLELPLGIGDPDLDERVSQQAAGPPAAYGDTEPEEPSVGTSSRLRSWSREFAHKRRLAAESFRLRPLNDCLLGEVRSLDAFNGGALRRLREERGVDLDTISDQTKISLMYLRFIEQDHYENLPAAIYLKGFVNQYAELLSLPSDVVDRYMDHYQQVCG